MFGTTNKILFTAFFSIFGFLFFFPGLVSAQSPVLDNFSTYSGWSTFFGSDYDLETNVSNCFAGNCLTATNGNRGIYKFGSALPYLDIALTFYIKGSGGTTLRICSTDSSNCNEGTGEVAQTAIASDPSEWRKYDVRGCTYVGDTFASSNFQYRYSVDGIVIADWTDCYTLGFSAAHIGNYSGIGFINAGTYSIQLDELNTTEADPIPDTSTHFESFTPNLGTTTPVATSTAFTFGATGYVSSDDFSTSSTKLYIRYRQLTGMGIRGNSSFGSNGDFFLPITSSGEFDLSTTTSVLQTGVYAAYYAIEVPRFTLFGINILTNTVQSAIGNFVVGEASSLEIQQVQFLANTTGSGVDVNIPTDESATSTLFDLGRSFGLADVVLSKFPINWAVEYANVLYDLGSSTATSTIPEVVMDFGSMATLQAIATTTDMDTEVTFFTADTLYEVAEIPAIGLMRTVAGWMLWLGLVSYAWRRAGSLFATARN